MVQFIFMCNKHFSLLFNNLTCKDSEMKRVKNYALVYFVEVFLCCCVLMVPLFIYGTVIDENLVKSNTSNARDQLLKIFFDRKKF